MRKRYLFLMTLLFPLATMLSSGTAKAADPDKALYDAAIAAVPDGSYYITTEVDGVKYYITKQGELVERTEYDEVADGLFQISQVTGGALYDVGFLIEAGSGSHFSNTTLSSDKAVLNPQTGVFRMDSGNNRNDWERQVFYLNEEGKLAIRSCNTAYGESSWADAGRAFWTYEVDEAGDPVYSEFGLMPAYSYEPAFIWTLEQPAGFAQVKMIYDGIYNKYEAMIWEYDPDAPTTVNLGTEFGQLAGFDIWKELYAYLQEINAIYDKIREDGYDYYSDPEAPTLEEAQAAAAKADSLYQALLDSEVPYTMPQNGYYRIIAHNRYKSTFDESGFVDKAIAASFDKNHEGKAVHATLRRDRANFLWKLTKSETGDSILIQNAGLGTYISRSLTDQADNKVVMTDNPDDISYVMFDYAYDMPQYVEPDGIGEEKDIFSIRLASKSRNDNRYIHQMNHASVADDASPWGNYSVDSGTEQELGFWIRTWNANRTNDLNTSEWFLEYVPDEEAEQIIKDFEAIFNHDKLVQQNAELRAKVLETLTKAKDVAHIKMIKSVDQLSSPYSDSVEGKDLGVLLDGDAATFWHTDWHGESPEGMYYNDIECHYLQFSGMEELVGDCELYVRERNSDDDRVKSLALFGTDNLKNEDDEWELIADLTLPNTGKGAESTVSFKVETPYPYIRMLVYNTDGANYAFRKFWHAAEIQLYRVEENPNSQFILMGQVAQDLQDAYDANCAIADADLDLKDYEALKAAYEAFLAAGLADPDEMRNALDTYAKTTTGVVEGTQPGQWEDVTVPNQFNELYAEIEAYNKAGRYDQAQIHKYAVMLKAMQKSVAEKANGVKTDKWYRIMVPTEEMYDTYGISKEGVDKSGLREDQATLFGNIVVPAVSVSEADVDEEGNEITVNHLEAIGGEDLRESNRLYFMAEDEIEDKDASMFRFVEQEADASDYTALFQDVKNNMVMALDMSVTYTKGEPLITKASQLSSNASDRSEGTNLGNLIDGNPATFWHSDWHKDVMAPPYLQVALNEPVSGLIEVAVTRRQGSDFGSTVRMFVQGSTDGEAWTNVGYVELPFTSVNESISSQPVDLGGSFSYLRFINTCRNTNGTGGVSPEMDPFAEPASVDEYDKTWTYFHSAEFQVYPVTADNALSASGKALQDAFAAANKIVIKDVTAEDLAAASQAYKTFQAEFNAKEGKAVLPNGVEKAPSTYALQNKATGLFVFVDGTGNQNNVYLKTIPTMYSYKALGYERSLLSGKNLKGESTNNMHAGESDRRFCTWTTANPESNSGLVIREADEEYAAPESFTYTKDVKPGRIIDWCNSVSITPVDAPDDAVAYSAVGQYTTEDGEEAETFLALKAVESIPAGEPAIFIFGDTISYDAEDEYVEPIKFTIPGNEKPVFEGKAVNGLIGTLVSLPLNKYLIYFEANYAATPAEGQNLSLTPCSAALDLDNCPVVDPAGNYDFSISLGKAASDVIDGVKDITTAVENVSKPGNVYTMDGKLLRTGATLNSLKSLGKGMYILNGVKVVVK